MSHQNTFDKYISDRSQLSQLVINIRNSKAYFYYEWQGKSKNSNNVCWKPIDNFKEAKTYTGSVTQHTKKRIEKAVSLLLQKSKEHKIFNPITEKEEMFRINFITLTVHDTSKNYTASETYKMLLKPFLQWLTKTQKVTDYIWKAELQKRGQIHYHITTNKWIHYQLIKDKWNNLMRQNNMLIEYFKKFKTYNPNSTDVHKVYKIKNIEAYLCKYLSKKESDKNNTKGKVWDCSNSLKGKKYFTAIFDEATELKLREYIKHHNCKGWSNDYCDIIFMQEGYIQEILTKSDYQQYEKYLATLI